MDWASFLIVQAAFAAPIPSGPADPDQRRGLGHLQGATRCGAWTSTTAWGDGRPPPARARPRPARRSSPTTRSGSSTTSRWASSGRSSSTSTRGGRWPASVAATWSAPGRPARRDAAHPGRAFRPGRGADSRRAATVRELRRAAPAIWLLLVTQTVGQVVGYWRARATRPTRSSRSVGERGPGLPYQPPPGPMARPRRRASRWDHAAPMSAHGDSGDPLSGGKRNLPRGWMPSSASPSGWRPRTTARTCSAPSSMRPGAPCASTTSRSASLQDEQLRRRGLGRPDATTAAPCPTFGVDEGWVGEVLRTGRVMAWPDVRDRPALRRRALRRIVEFAGDLVAPLLHHDRVIGTLSAVTREPRAWTRRRHRLHHDPGDPRRHRPDQRRAVRADRGPGRPAGRPAGRLRPAQPGLVRRGRRAHRRRGGAPDHRLPQRPGLPHRAARPGRADRLRGPGRRLRAGRPRPAALPPRRGLHAAGSRSTASRSWSTTPTPTRAARPSSGPTTSTNRCSSCRCATTA